ncbi:zinc-binding dehydrogenase [Endozoicomonas sp. SM1973]|uniref:Zinc-binding dehydrogenase n=1 Tax=Spartinivicinus marinus TaxID=2994442 RepID=A0A853IDP6_9GAMM|nr:bi-domain-containing oxidoreductase [Spartinivicinus marinus]MCX4028822.1 bi-domain-containing oxidoreductase [Spartinivicinus marinus]NYZ67637.1 zinc-binding dehydrogenase [Spartinivicinus marinus]
MKQILQNMSSGETQLVDVPCPQVTNNQLLVSTKKSLISVGTERMLIDFGKANWIEKARSQPDKVKMVLDKVKTDGVGSTIEAIRSKLDQPLPLGYCNVGTVIDPGGTDFEIGQRVVSNGHHAEVVRVYKNLCVRVPDEVDDESAAFTVLGAIALQGTRLIQPTLGEVVVVTGLGLIGLITVQILRASGCRVLGIDFDSYKCELAKQFGAEVVNLSNGEDPIAKASAFSRGRGVDAVIITASTKSNEPVSQAAKMCRKRGRIVLVGVVGLELSRADFYQKEISFQVSCSYGPGRYDLEYEEKGHDYPVGFVRWTEQRNFEAVLDLMASSQLNVKPLISHRFTLEDVFSAYTALEDKYALGILLEYSDQSIKSNHLHSISLENNFSYQKEEVVCAFFGAGNYASRVLIPAFVNSGVKLDTIVTSGGITAVHHGKKNNFATAATDIKVALNNEKINTIVIATRHNLHAQQVIESLLAGKNVFVEKPLALTEEELSKIEKVYKNQVGKLRLMVGFNRRFAPQVIKMKELLSRANQPKCLIMTMNAGAIDSNHWTQDPTIGGGRIIGEACHYIDLMRFLVGCRIVDFKAMKMGAAPGIKVRNDKSSITLSFEDGSLGTIHYFANGGKAFPKERIEVFCNNAALQLNNFRQLTGFDWKGFKKTKLLTQDKGQKACIKAFTDAIHSGSDSPISFEEIMDVSRIAVKVAEVLS